jgi:parallel beta-helix repeat protein
MEVAGVNGFTISNCTFKDQELKSGIKTLTYESIQLDILAKKHIVATVYEELPSKNISITGCTFKNVPRGVGSHTTVLNDPIRDITIKNNTFSDIKSCAVQLLNVLDCEISGNKITSAPRGITVFSAVFNSQDTFLASTLAAQGGSSTNVSDKYQTPAKNMKIAIKNNSITIKGTDPYATYERCGIWINGQDAAKAYKNSSGDKIPRGNYYMSGVTISGNTVKGNGHGIKLIDTRNCNVKNNKLTFTGKISSINYYGITAKIDSKNITATNNTATGYLNNIYIVDSTAKSLSGNNLNRGAQYGDFHNKKQGKQDKVKRYPHMG